MRASDGILDRVAAQPPPVNWAMHFGQAALLGVLRSLMSQAGLRGPLASAKFTVVRLTNDQILENATGVGAQPATWPHAELIVDPCMWGLDRLRGRNRVLHDAGPRPHLGPTRTHPFIRVRGRSRRRTSDAALCCYKPCEPTRLIHRPRAHLLLKGTRKSFSW
ncbi:hypothetical protein [Streptomyces sp. NPDC002962]|uniref:hypothetical protein n=1 Tax=Streptomyces sp. NPDC002962 TaxID=3364674 RepID=UPI00369BF6AE